jgi:integrase
MPEVTAARSITVTTGTYAEVIEAVQRDALDSMATLFVVEPEKTSGCSTLPPIAPSVADDELRFPGGAKGIRTPDPHTASVVRYQLRHSPEDVPVEVTPRPASLQSR